MKVNSRSSLIIPIVVGVALVAIIVGAVALNQNRQSTALTSPDNLTVPVVTVQPQPTQPIPFPEVPRISPEETQAKLEKGQAVLIDVRGKESYDQLHAVGALSFPEGEILSRLSELPRDKELILYCT